MKKQKKESKPHDKQLTLKLIIHTYIKETFDLHELQTLQLRRLKCPFSSSNEGAPWLRHIG